MLMGVGLLIVSVLFPLFWEGGEGCWFYWALLMGKPIQSTNLLDLCVGRRGDLDTTGWLMVNNLFLLSVSFEMYGFLFPFKKSRQLGL